MVKHLPPAIKHLLSLRNPNSHPSPPLLKLHGILNSTLTDAKRRKAENGWLVLTTCTLLTANIPSSVGHLYRFITEPPNTNLSDSVKKAALMRESALKSVIFVGVPRTILSLAALSDALEDDVKSALRKDPLRTGTPKNIETTVARGRALWSSIYEPHADKLYAKLGSYHPDFIEFIIQSYGSVLAPLPGGDQEQGNLSRTLGSVVGTACLRAEGRVGPQLTSHVFGLLKARKEDQLCEEDRWLSSDEGAEWVIRTVDILLDSLTPEADGEAKVKL
ncbi:hypothetical protein PILCRDRAFT_811534 [Piloderma croceum F 1598]|uniref:Dol-P-Man:Man(5)GlcNAc(2)-PP-Dol alpha-1,3-mannosyltransferase n=1 Tax=Piloderma croceum (strain F 1598) TaxID=765440 RepID=A0A0C3G3Y6_PILCF|nr:hypothetical protein PILCRDRAFT_811534 [Piloderma croceum F 1598]